MGKGSSVQVRLEAFRERGSHPMSNCPKQGKRILDKGEVALDKYERGQGEKDEIAEQVS